LLVCAILLAGCARLANRAPNGASSVSPAITVTNSVYTAATTVQELNVQGQVRNYRLHVPPSYRAGQPVPLVINFHGYGSNGQQEEQVSRMSTKADEAGFIAVYPEGSESPQNWKMATRIEGQADVQFIRELITTLKGQYSIDAKRIDVTGISNGAEMSYRLACDLSDVVAAFAPVAGGYPAYMDCEPTRPVPVVAFHGTDDNILPYTGMMPLLLPVRDWAASWAKRNGCAATPATTYKHGEVTGETWSGCRNGADVVLYTIDGKGHSWPGSNMPADITTRDVDATDVMWAFFLAHPMK
jgi:polyhydroxybutyrate depolymerase